MIYLIGTENQAFFPKSVYLHCKGFYCGSGLDSQLSKVISTLVSLMLCCYICCLFSKERSNEVGTLNI